MTSTPINRFDIQNDEPRYKFYLRHKSGKIFKEFRKPSEIKEMNAKRKAEGKSNLWRNDKGAV